MKRKRVIVLGATGSIGESALKVAHDIPERMEIVGLAANRNGQKLAEQANRVRPKAVCLVDESKMGDLRSALQYEPQVGFEEGLKELAEWLTGQVAVDRVEGMRDELNSRGLAI